MWCSQPPTAQPRTQFKPVSAQLLWQDWQLCWPVKRRLGLLQYNWDIRSKPMSTHWGRVTNICVSEPSHHWTLDNGLAPIQCQAMIWSDIHCLINCTLGNKRCGISIKIQRFLFKKMHLKMSSAKMAYILHLYQYCSEGDCQIAAWGYSGGKWMNVPPVVALVHCCSSSGSGRNQIMLL